MIIDPPSIGATNWGPDLNEVLEQLAAGIGQTHLDVKSYGAIGDGTTDDTTSVQSVIDAVDSAGGGVVFFPQGTYMLTTELSIPAGVSLRGTGPLSSIILQDDTASNGISLNNIGANYTSITGLGITGPGSGTGNGINLVRTTLPGNQIGTKVSDVIVKDFGNDGVHISGAIMSTLERVLSLTNGRDGFHFERIDPNAGVTSLTVQNCYANAPTRYGYYLSQAIDTYVSFVGCATDNAETGYYLEDAGCVGLYTCGSEAATDNSYVIDGCTAVTLSSCLSSASEGRDYHITGNSTHITLTSCKSTAAGTGHTAGIEVDSGSRALVINHFTSSSVTSAGGNIYNGSVSEYNESPNTGIVMGGDTSIYRGAANLLQSGDGLKLASGLVNSGAVPEDLGLLAWGFDPNSAASNTTLADGTIYLMSVFVRGPITANKVGFILATPGTSLTAGQCWVGLYDSSGNKLSDGAAETALAGSGYQTVTLGTPQALTAGRYYVAFVSNGSGTDPALIRGGAGSGTANAGAPTAATLRFATNATGQTTLPGSVTLASNTAAQAIWAALSA